MRVGVVALVLGFSVSTIIRWTRTGRLPCKQFKSGDHRYVQAEDLAWFAHQMGLTPHWEKALENC
ncbi:helix-turn-helix domain-containing protein [Deinococcus rubellus]